MTSMRRNERGTSLVEVMIAMMIMTSIVGIVGPILVSSMRTTGSVEAQSRTIDELRIAMASIGRELRSAECVYSPAVPAGASSASGTTLDFRTVANNVVNRVVYTIDGSTLTRQVNAGALQKVAQGLTAGSFVQFSTPRRSVRLDFSIRLGTSGAPDRLATTIAGRNAWRVCVP
jgi:Tfp pilus assembly protein PilW